MIARNSTIFIITKSNKNPMHSHPGLQRKLYNYHESHHKRKYAANITTDWPHSFNS